MKSSIKGFFVILAIVMSFVLVQGVYARDMEKVTKDSFTETVKSVDETTRSITLDLGTDEDDDGFTDSITIFGMGPSWYWDDVVEIPYPNEGDILEIEAFYCDILGEYVGITVCYIEPIEPIEKCNEFPCCILLRNDELKPVWNPKAKTTDLSDTAAEATGDCCPDCPDGGDCEPNDYNWKDEEEPAPHGKKDF